MDKARPVVTPCEAWLSVELSSPKVDTTEYQSAVGSLIYLTLGTRPDLAFAVGQVARFIHDPREVHWLAVKRILRYVAGTLDLTLYYTRKVTPCIVGYSDASYANDTDDRKSTGGYIFLRCGGAISWCSRKQHCVAKSTMESEYIALSDCVSEAL